LVTLNISVHDLNFEPHSAFINSCQLKIK